jgi:transposase
MAYIKSFKDQSWLLPPSLEDIIPEDHICYLVESLVALIDFTLFDVKYSGPGHPAYHPRILIKLLVMGVLDRVRSSRRLARNARENVVYMFLAEKTTPDFRTISDFRKNNPELVKEVFKHTVTLARSEGMIDLSHLSTDGSKQKANAANKRVLTKEELEFLLRFVDEELDAWAKQDNIEDGMFNDLRGNDQLPDKSRKKIRKIAKYYVEKTLEKGKIFKDKTVCKLNHAYQELQEHELNKINITDPDSRFMINKSGKIEFSYNVQLTVDKKGFILANDVCQDENDVNHLQPQILQTEKNIEGLSENIRWSFDNSYYEGENLKFLDEKKIDGYIPFNEKKEDSPYDKKHFIYDPVNDRYICPAGKPVTFLGEHYDKSKKKTARIYKGQECKTCLHQKMCTKQRKGIRYIKSFPYEKERNAMNEKMNTEKGKEIYKLRAITVEPAFGDIKENKGMRAFLTRGIKTVKTEFNLVCTASNLKKIWIELQKKNNDMENIIIKNPSNASNVIYTHILPNYRTACKWRSFL